VAGIRWGGAGADATACASPPGSTSWPAPARAPTSTQQRTPRPPPPDPDRRAPGVLLPSGTNMNRVAAARTTGCYRKSVPGRTTKHTGCSRTPHPHTRAPGPAACGLWREEGDLGMSQGSQLATVLGRKAEPAGGCGGGGGTARRRPRGTGRWPLACAKAQKMQHGL
jgi:hypothetical protein